MAGARPALRGQAKADRDAKIVKLWNGGGLHSRDLASRFGVSTRYITTLLIEAKRNGLADNRRSDHERQ